MEMHDTFMQAALEQARLAYDRGDVPVGAVVVIEGQIIAAGFNKRQALGDPTAHAEMEALRLAGQHVGNWRIEGDLYVTQEPCPMCAGAIVNARVRRLIYGCANPKAGAVDTLYQIPTDTRLNHRVEVVRGVRASECAALLSSFFQSLRSV